MLILDTSSLVNTIDHINQTLLEGKKLSPETGLDAARWIASRQGAKGAYRGMFAPTPDDFEHGIHLFTGERLESASARHILGEEAARVVWLLGRQETDLRAAYDRATGWMHAVPETSPSGVFCCGRCGLAFWRHFWVGEFDNKEAFVVRGIGTMKEQRLGDGKWRRFPFYYAIYVLQDIEVEPALEELRYARAAIERYLRYARPGDYTERRRTIFEKALEKVN